MPNRRFKEVKIHGHRGWRSMYSENTLTGFCEACKLGVDALELDVVIAADRQIIVSHDPYMKHDICAMPDGTSIQPESELTYNLFQMNSEEIFDFLPNPVSLVRFPNQITKVEGFKPTLKKTIEVVKKYCRTAGIEMPLWNIELKSQPNWDNLYHPSPKEYVGYFLDTFSQLGIEENSILQCFDFRILRELHLQVPELKLVLLTDEQNGNLSAHISTLGFKPFGYSPQFQLINESTVTDCLNAEVELLAWTVNETEDMMRLMELGLKNIITDFPDKALQLIGRKV